jgi:asparagine synthase (glutamine-hydrolysing)
MFKHEQKHIWGEASYSSLTCWSVGHSEFIKKELGSILNNFNINKISATIKPEAGFFAFYLEDENSICIATDHIRSYPVFYCIDKEHNLIASPQPRLLIPFLDSYKFSEQALTELFHSGYCFSNRTIYEKIFQIGSGEIIFFNKAKRHLEKFQYDQYISNYTQKNTNLYYLNGLKLVLDDIFGNLYERVKNNPVLIPLSGGLDSRLILCKLHEYGHKNIQSFSYGPLLNTQALIAKEVANILNVPWTHITTSAKKSKSLFNSSDRIKYWEFSDGLCTLPDMSGYIAFKDLTENYKIQNNTVVINGQTGDFISGGHIPVKTRLATQEDFISYCLSKHCSIWKHKSHRSHKYLTKAMRNFLNKNALKNMPESKYKYYSAFEHFEFCERQAKYIVNGQRLYDYLNLKWELPWWDKRIVHFYKNVPFSLKANRSLLKLYLADYNYYSLFSKSYPQVESYPGKYSFLAKLYYKFKLFSSFNYKYLDEFFLYNSSHYANQFSMFSFSEACPILLKSYSSPASRGALALLLDKWFTQNGLDLMEK